MEDTGLKQALAIIDRHIAEVASEREAAGKNNHGVYLKPKNEESIALGRLRTEILFAYNESPAGINEALDAAFAKAPVDYAAIHPVSPNSIQLYALDGRSPSGRFHVGTLPSTSLAREMIKERGISFTLSNAIKA